MKAPSKTNNYFRVRVSRGAARRSLWAEGEAKVPAEDATPGAVLAWKETVAEKARKVLAKKPDPVDWGVVFFFDEHDPSSILRAYEDAKRVTSPSGISVYRRPMTGGPWATCPLIGTTPLGAN
jgi:hypothetical protein